MLKVKKNVFCGGNTSVTVRLHTTRSFALLNMKPVFQLKVILQRFKQKFNKTNKRGYTMARFLKFFILFASIFTYQTITFSQTADELNKQAMDLFLHGKMQEAIDKLYEALRKDSTHVSAHINLGYIHYFNGKNDEAIAEYKKALHFDPQNALAHNYLANAYFAVNNYKESIKEYQQAIKYNPKYPQAYNNLAYCLFTIGLYDLAIKEAQKAIELNPKYATAYVNLGQAYHAKGMYDEAETQFKKALEIDSTLVIAHNNLGVTYRVKGMLDEAIKEHLKCIELDSLNAQSYNNLGLCYFEKGETDKAIQVFNKALQIAPNYAIVHNNIAYAYYDALNYSMAMQHAKAAERLGIKVNEEFMDNLIKALDPQYMRARHILVKTQAEAEQILAQLKRGTSFKKLAESKSLDQATASRGGDFGYFKKGDLRPEFERIIASLKVGEISNVIKTELGYHIFQRLN